MSSNMNHNPSSATGMLLSILHLIGGILIAMGILLMALLFGGGMQHILLMAPALILLGVIALVSYKTHYKNLSYGIIIGSVVLVLVTLFYFSL